MKNKLFIVGLIIFVQVAVSSCGMVEQKYFRTGFALGTDVSITVFSTKAHWEVECELDSIFEKIDLLESKVSSNIESSEISILNEKKHLIVRDNFVLTLLNNAAYFATITNGAFDPTIGSVLKLWDFCGSPKVPSSQDIQRELSNVDYHQLRVNLQTREVDIGKASIDLGAIAKGAIVDTVSRMLVELGYKNFLVNGGGDIYVHGKHSGRRPWRIAVANPFEKGGFLDKLTLTDCAVVTSGDYERYFVENYVVYHHILDPKTGYPTNNRVHSVTVVADDVTTADSLATAMFVMGSSEAMKYCQQYNQNNQKKQIKVIIVSGEKENPIINRFGF